MSLYSKINTAALVLLILGLTFQQSTAQDLVVVGDTVYTMKDGTKPSLNKAILVEDGVIEDIIDAEDLDVDDDVPVYQANVVTPGFIDAHSVVGLAGIYNVEADQDQLDTSDPIQPQLRAIDAYNAREELVKFLRTLGITTVHTGHGPGALMSGQTMIVKTAGETVDEAVVTNQKMIAMTLGAGIEDEFKSPGTRAKAVAMIRDALVQGREYMKKQEDDEDAPTDLKMEAIAQLLNGELTALITAHDARDIMTALRLSEEFGFDLVLDGAAEAYSLIDEIKEANVPVIIHPTMIRTFGDSQHASFETAAKLRKAGIPVYFQSGFEGYVPKTRVVTFEAAIAIANGLPRSEALQMLTIDAAEFLGVEDQVGSLAEDKDADIVLYNGDPFEYTTNVEMVIIDGKVVSERSR